MIKEQKYQKDTEAWTENSARVYNLVLGHCPSDLCAEMLNQSMWAANALSQDYIVLLLMIRDLTHNMKETMQATMALVSSHSDLYTTVQEKGESLEDYYKVFIARKDTVNAHGGEAGRHKELYQLARKKIMTEMKVKEIYMSNVNNRAAANKIDLEASTKSKE